MLEFLIHTFDISATFYLFNTFCRITKHFRITLTRSAKADDYTSLSNGKRLHNAAAYIDRIDFLFTSRTKFNFFPASNQPPNVKRVNPAPHTKAKQNRPDGMELMLDGFSSTMPIRIGSTFSSIHFLQRILISRFI